MASSPGQKVVSDLDAIQPNQFASETERYAAKEAARRLLGRLETPFERGWHLTFETPVLVAALQTCLNLGIWAQWTKSRTAQDDDGGSEAKSLDDIVGMCNARVEPNLLRRLLRHTATLNVLEETDVDTWKPTPFSLSLGDEASHLHNILDFGTDHSIITGANLPKLLAKNSYAEPLDPKKLDNYTDTNGLDFFALCQREPAKAASFRGLMTALRNSKMDWTEVYDTSKIVEGAELDDVMTRPLFVDVGGMHGLDSARLLARHPELPEGALVLQDLPEVVATEVERLDPRIRKMAYDFFTPQPLVGSRAYFFHAVPHDWPDAECERIFQRVAAAMRPGYSKLLVYEIVLPARGASSLMTTLDLQLMNICSGLERTEADWVRLLGRAGLRVVGISRHPRALESVIEAELE